MHLAERTVHFGSVMIEKSIEFARAWLPEAGSELRLAECKAMIPTRSARRMSLLGKIVYWLLEPAPPIETDAIVYATTHAESRALEKYIRDLPDAASPTLFQTSVHPGGIQQALIARQQAVGILLPLCGEAHLIAQLCQSGLTLHAEQTYLVLAEEQGDVLLPHGLASPASYGVVLKLSASHREESLGTLRWDPCSPGAGQADLDPLAFVRAVESRRSIHWDSPMGGRIELEWNP